MTNDPTLRDLAAPSPALPRSRTSGIDRSLQILDILTERHQPMTAYDLAKVTGAPPSTVYKLIEELVERAMLTRGADGRAWLGPRLMRYGLAYRARMSAFGEAERAMFALNERVGEMVQICTRDEGMMQVVAMAEGTGPFRVTSDVGTRVPLNWTASGRLLVGHLPDAARVEVFRKWARASNTGLAETDPDKLAEVSRRDFLDGLSVQIDTSEDQVACIAAPVRGQDGTCQLTLSVVMPKHRVLDKFDLISQEVRDAARSVERALGLPHR
ncbi:IclR family transcriptional regulator [Paracoccus liaowanqingii]|uniref:IclR family transcriptional regulator n=1 Tax=Paracoccus liaowanqingii TaxID=2560053 RepID=A0A4Z1CRL5_9RHOB|nr:IclR family transcriptional regulator [Paracoccus liaowanqingii]TGN67973.1 IclR family transcriptional regulator [Paracoccus liaowanqingii]